MTRPTRFLPAVALTGMLLAGCAPPEESAAPVTGLPAAPAPAPAPITAEAHLEAIADVALTGHFDFEQLGETVQIEGSVEGLEDGLYGFHIHEGTTCEDRGGHFDPTGHPHGSPDSVPAQRHVGDLGNLVSRDGMARFARTDRVVRLSGEHSVIGRVLVLHGARDQFLPQPTGDAGAQIGCGVIERSSPGV